MMKKEHFLFHRLSNFVVGEKVDLPPKFSIRFLLPVKIRNKFLTEVESTNLFHWNISRHCCDS